jgi:CheY-like chemotaxis protein
MSERPRVLVIDDDLDHLEILTKVLEAENDVLVASDGIEGYAVACVERPAVVLLDILMPVVDGWTVIRKLRTNPRTREIRVVVITALDPASVRQQLDALRVDAVLKKPLNLADARSIVKRLQRPARPAHS